MTVNEKISLSLLFFCFDKFSAWQSAFAELIDVPPSETDLAALTPPESPAPAPVLPRVVRSEAPDYPYRAFREGIEGQVRLQFRVDDRGKPRDIEVLASEPPKQFDKAARKALKRWRFEPATLNGKPVDVYYNLTVNFRLE